jgi:hypothetical protein
MAWTIVNMTTYIATTVANSMQIATSMMKSTRSSSLDRIKPLLDGAPHRAFRGSGAFAERVETTCHSGLKTDQGH